jgi:hypothetical protein
MAAKEERERESRREQEEGVVVGLAWLMDGQAGGGRDD